GAINSEPEGMDHGSCARSESEARRLDEERNTPHHAIGVELNVWRGQDHVPIRLLARGAWVGVGVRAAEVPDRDLVDTGVRLLDQLAVAGYESARGIRQDNRNRAVAQSRSELRIVGSRIRKADIEADNQRAGTLQFLQRCRRDTSFERVLPAGRKDPLVDQDGLRGT